VQCVPSLRKASVPGKEFPDLGRQHADAVYGIAVRLGGRSRVPGAVGVGHPAAVVEEQHAQDCLDLDSEW